MSKKSLIYYILFNKIKVLITNPDVYDKNMKNTIYNIFDI